MIEFAEKKLRWLLELVGKGAVQIDHAPVAVFHEAEHRNAIHEQLEALLAFEQGRLGCFPASNVGRRADDSLKFASLVEDRPGIDAQVRARAIFVTAGRLEVEHHLALHAVLKRLHRSLPLFGRDEFCKVLAEDLLRLIPGHRAQGRAVHVGPDALRIETPEQLVGDLGETVKLPLTFAHRRILASCHSEIAGRQQTHVWTETCNRHLHRDRIFTARQE